jgi:uncharacterized membrane protein
MLPIKGALTLDIAWTLLFLVVVVVVVVAWDRLVTRLPG